MHFRVFQTLCECAYLANNQCLYEKVSVYPTLDPTLEISEKPRKYITLSFIVIKSILLYFYYIKERNAHKIPRQNRGKNDIILFLHIPRLLHTHTLHSQTGTCVDSGNR